MFRNKSASSHQFAMIPKAEIPRSSFQMQKTLKTTFDSGFLVPIMCEEVLPGDTFNCRMTAFCRLATPLFPVMDNMYLETFFFFVPNRLVWDNWQKFMGERVDPDDTIDFLIPQMEFGGGSPYDADAFLQPLTIYDYFGLPIYQQLSGGATVSFSALPFRAYNLIYNEWFRDQNLQDSLTVTTGDGPDNPANYALRRRGKRHDYFTSCLPFTQKGEPVQLPLGSTAPVDISGLSITSTGSPFTVTNSNIDPTTRTLAMQDSPTLGVQISSPVVTGGQMYFVNTGTELTGTAFADLSDATAATINQIRQAFQIQKLLERDARGGTRYTEIVRSHFGVISPDARLQRPEYLGGGKTPININPVAQTQEGGTTPLATLAGIGTALARQHGFSQSFTEHGHIIGLAQITADLTYQQGMRRMWSRRTRYDFYFPVFAALGEQAVLNKEIYCTGETVDEEVFGYQERWAEYRYNPSQITGLFRSTSPGTIDPWHLAQVFDALPTLNSQFISDSPPLDRIIAVGEEANGQQLLFDGFFDIRAARPMPLYSVPGLVDHF